MKVTEGSLRLAVAEGRKAAAVRVWRMALEPAGWMWSASRDFGEEDRVGKAGKAATWAGAYRAGMRAAERLLARKAP